MRPRYRREVEPRHVGERVSIRRWVDDAEAGRRPSDIVGRLAAWEDDELVVVRRDGRRVHVPAGDVLASRVIPPHPKLPPEPSG